jgi:hypothetical protein
MQAFDIVVKQNYVKFRIFQIWFTVGCAAFLFLLVASKGEEAFVPPWPWSLIAAIILAGGVGILVMARGAAHPFASRIEVTREGLTLKFPEGKFLAYSWKDPRLRVAFQDCRGSDFVLRHPQEAYFVVAMAVGSPRLRLTPIPPEALVAALSEAEAQGCRIRPADWREPTLGRRAIVVDRRRGSGILGAFQSA